MGTTEIVIGMPTLHTRVEQWECDFNGHWNARFYGRTFAAAAEVVASLENGAEPVALPTDWLLRFHQELVGSTAVEVRSAVVRDETPDATMVHVLSGGGVTAATALAWPSNADVSLPSTTLDDASIARPRSLSLDRPRIEFPRSGEAHAVEVGLLPRTSLDAAGQLRLEELMRFVAYGLHGFSAALGMDARFTEDSGVSRMLVECRVELARNVRVGRPLRVQSVLQAVSRNGFRTGHVVRTIEGAPVAWTEMFSLTVDLRRRRTVEVPDFVRRRLC